MPMLMGYVLCNTDVVHSMLMQVSCVMLVWVDDGRLKMTDAVFICEERLLEVCHQLLLQLLQTRLGVWLWCQSR